MTRANPWSRREFLRRAGLAAPAAALAACSVPTDGSAPPPSPRASTGTPSIPAVPSWAPAPARYGELAAVAEQREQQLLLHTAGGDVTFWAGVTLSGTLPGAPPGAVTATASDYRRWLPMMADLGIHLVRLTQVHPPAFYAELRAYNTAHPDAPLYLLQGVTLRSAPTDLDLFSPATTRAMDAEIRDASAAVHGRLRRRAIPGRPSGSWTADVSAWTAAWLVDVAAAPAALAASDEANTDAPRHAGQYFTSLAQGTPTEHWLAARMDVLAGLEAGQGLCAPIGFVNRPETDPLTHGTARTPSTDVVALDANNVVATRAWPAGTFAGFEAAPYAPLLRLDTEYTRAEDPFAAYVRDLGAHHPRLPLFVTSTGVSSALGSGDVGANGREQGDHNEQEQARINADLLRLLRDIGATGALLPAWHDEWSATTWNTAPRYATVAPARRVLWHDALTADQWRGVITHDPARAGERIVHTAPGDGLQRVLVDTDAAWLYLTLEFGGRVTSPVEIGFDFLDIGGLRLPGGSGTAVHDVAIRMVPTMSTAYVFVRSALDPIRFDGLPATALPRGDGNGWRLARLSLDRRLRRTGREVARPSFLEVGDLQLGAWDPAAASPDSLATWELSRESSDQPARLRFRLPWSMLGFVDPSARTVLEASFVRPETTNVRALSVTVESSTPGSPVTFPLSWQTWNSVRVTERLKAGSDVLAEAFAHVSRR